MTGWFDEWVLQPVVPLAHRLGEGAQRAGEGCMSANAFGSDWAQLESGTLRTGQRPFRDPLNKERRFLPLRLDDAPIKGSLAQFRSLNFPVRRVSIRP